MKINKHVILLPLLAAFVFVFLGCGYDPQDPAYDTASNPDSYPEAALELLNDIDSGLLFGADNIGGRFAELYTSHSNLLDNIAWKKVIERLGFKFSYIADTLAGSGPSAYSMAAGYYNLASFAIPDDGKAADNSDMFRCWTEVLAGSKNLKWPEIDKTSISEQLAFVRQFWTLDDRRRRFARTYLLPHLLDGINESNSLSPDDLSALDPVEIAFASMLGLASIESITPLAKFDAGIQLLAARVISNDSSNLVECYFILSDEVTENYSISIRVGSIQSERERLIEDLAFIPYRFDPLSPSSEWKMGKVYAAYFRFDSNEKISKVAIGLFVTDSDPMRLASIIGSDKNHIEVPVIY